MPEVYSYRSRLKSALTNLRDFPEQRTLNRERRGRGKRELNRIERSDAILFSPGNSGRTWLRVMLTRIIEHCYSIEPSGLINFDNLHKLDPRAPIISVTHNRWVPYYRKPAVGSECAAYYGSRVLMLVRNPIDTCVSQYFQWKHRSKDSNILLKGWPARSDDIELIDFMMMPETGVERLCNELNTWLTESEKFQGALIVRYEDLLGDTPARLGEITEFLALPATPEILNEAIEYGSFGSMKQREVASAGAEAADAAAAAGASGSVASDQDAHKTRAGKIAGYRDYFSPEQCRVFEDMVSQQLHPGLGYTALPDIIDAPMLS